MGVDSEISAAHIRLLTLLAIFTSSVFVILLLAMKVAGLATSLAAAFFFSIEFGTWVDTKCYFLV